MLAIFVSLSLALTSILQCKAVFITWLYSEAETEQKNQIVLAELEDDYEKRLADRARQLEDKAEEARRAQKEHQEERRQIEEDVDGEILQIKDKYERKLKQELDTNMRLKVKFPHLLLTHFWLRAKLAFCGKSSATCNARLKRAKKRQRVQSWKTRSFSQPFET